MFILFRAICTMDYDYFNGRPRDVIAEHARRVRYQVFIRFRLRDAHNPLDMSIEGFVELYRMPQDIFLDLLEVITPFVPHRQSRLAIPLYMRLLCALSFYATGTYQEHNGTAMHHPMSQASVSYCIKEVTNALNHPLVFTRFVRFPLTHAERLALVDRNARMGLPGVIGLIDGTIIRITPPPKPNVHYYSRKGSTSLNVMIVCDTDLNIINVNARYPGSSHDSHVYNNSTVRDVMEAAFREDPCWLLGDQGYPRLPWLMTPVWRPVRGTPEYYYNVLHSRVRMVVERCIGVLKARWRCICNDNALPYRPEKSGQIINACVVLHNILTRCRLAVPVHHAGFQDPREPNYVVPPEYEDVGAFFADADAVQAELVDHANWFMNRNLH
ncbi:putative nuclease HARBI1 [Frankliniella occidentalis]|uniref:Nuclease HARBI1 n=1 Tax=Frankliniella occidentalis TaxID=133901 RepID=A0A6J1T8E9_FRAOC|nr:putative nuclease HARBI1 [Frankliniella occidentalis]